MTLALYIHYPFCLQKCSYCDFNSVAGSPLGSDAYLELLLREMSLRSALFPGGERAATLYFGGGTPSLMEPALVGRIVDAAAGLFGLADDAEITIEANPGTVTRERLAGYLKSGVNRLSLGIQSFDDRLLARLGRVHTAREALDAYHAARAAGFDNVGIDLIHALPGQTLAMWQEALAAAVRLAPEHISAYGLSVEEGTPLQQQLQGGGLQLPSDDEAADMFEITSDHLERHGYEHYEISNFARPGCRSRHNQVYWQRGTYLGFGAGAHSFVAADAAGKRWQNAASLLDYCRSLEVMRIPELDQRELSRAEALSERLFLGMRLREGVAMADLDREFGPDWREPYAADIPRLTEQGLLSAASGRLRLTRRGMLLSNRVLAFFV